MHSVHDAMIRKFVNSVNVEDLEIETDSGWQPISSIHRTIPYTVWILKTSSGKYLEAADTHIVFDEYFNQVFVKDLIPNQSKIITKQGLDTVVFLETTTRIEPMFDLTVNSKEQRFFSNDILSHNTSLINALSYALYGQALTNIKRDNLINNINGKNMLVTLCFERAGVEYRVERGRRPNIFRLFVNDVEQALTEQDDSQGDNRDTQKDLVEILGMSHDMFTHIIALNTYTESFLSMRTGDQRSIIEQLLGITQLSEKAELLKRQISMIKENIIRETANIDSIKKSNDKIQQSIDVLINRQQSWDIQHQQQLDQIADSIIELKDINIDHELDQHALLSEYQTQQAALVNLRREQTSLTQSLSQLTKSIDKCTQDLNLLANKQCHACGQHIQDVKYQEIVVVKQDQLDRAFQQYQEQDRALNLVVAEIAAIDQVPKPVVYYPSLEQALRHQHNLTTLEQQLLTKSNEINPYQDQIAELATTALQPIDWTVINELTQVQAHQEFLLKLLTNKDSFIRKKIIDQNLSYLNSRLTYYLDQINLPHIVTFQNDLSVTITQLGKDLDFNNLSRGERSRLIISLSFAFRDLWENLNSSVNLLFIDEMLDLGLDPDGVEHALKILKSISRDRKKNVFLISHKDELISRVNCVFKVVKSGGFTTFEPDTEVTT